MKKISISYILLPFVFSCLLALTSCEKFLETNSQSTYTEDILFSTATATEQALVGAYALAGMDEMYSSRLALYYTMSSDVEIVASDGNQYNDNERRSIGHYLATSGNSQLSAPWNALYKAIESTNLIIDNIPNSPIMSTGSTADKKKMQQYLGEALTLRAMYYTELVRNWGDVPFKTEPTNPDGSNIYLGKTNRDTIYNHLIADLLLAQSIVPWMGEGSVTVPTRITKGFVKGLLARICLYRGGYSLRAETNRMQRGSNYQYYYAIAREQCKDVIDKGKYKLNPSFANFFYKQCQLQADKDESVFELGFGMNQSSELGYYIGVRYDNSAKYGSTSGGVLTYPSYLYMFEKEDTRRLVTCAIYQVRVYGKDSKIRDSIYTNPIDFRIGKWSERDMSPQYLAQKANNSSKIFTGINWPVMRYSDVLLMFAEADNELNGPTAEGQAAFKQVRLRAMGVANETKVDDYMTARCASKTSFQDAIQDERALEFGGEGIRKFDLIRWNALDKIENAKTQSKSIVNSGTYVKYDGTVITTPLNLWYKYDANDGEKLDYATVALDAVPASTTGFLQMGWMPVSSASNKSKFNDFYNIIAKGLVDHPNRHLLPLSDATVNDSNGKLRNDYGY